LLFQNEILDYNLACSSILKEIESTHSVSLTCKYENKEFSLKKIQTSDYYSKELIIWEETFIVDLSIFSSYFLVQYQYSNLFDQKEIKSLSKEIIKIWKLIKSFSWL
jgi:hypothetical protein